MNYPGLSNLEAFNEEIADTQSRNDLLSELIARRPVVRYRSDSGGAKHHKWKVTVARAVGSSAGSGQDFGINPLTGQPYFSAHVFGNGSGAASASRLWKVYVGSGCVNDEPAAIQYQVKDDPRGWIMPTDYAPWKKLAEIYGADHPNVDRPLYERDRPFVLLTSPDANGDDLGGFEKIADDNRPPFFRTKEMWERHLYRAFVVVSATPYKADPWETSLHAGGAVAKRWRVQAGKLPIRVQGAGVTATDFKELARIYLAREPGKPENDQVHIQQVTFWSLHSRSAVNQSLVELAEAIATSAGAADLALLGLGAGGLAASVALLGIEAVLTEIFLANFEDIVASASTVEFWSV